MNISTTLVDLSNSLTENKFLITLTTILLIIFLGFVIGRLAGKLVLKLLKEIEFDKTIKKVTGYNKKFAKLISNTVSYIIYFLTIMMALEQLGIIPFVLNSLSIIILVMIAASILLSIKDFIPNFIAGYTIKNKEKFKAGDKIKVGSVEGKVIKINFLETHLETKNKDLIVVPNSYFVKNIVVKKK